MDKRKSSSCQIRSPFPLPNPLVLYLGTPCAPVNEIQQNKKKPQHNAECLCGSVRGTEAALSCLGNALCALTDAHVVEEAEAAGGSACGVSIAPRVVSGGSHQSKAIHTTLQLTPGGSSTHTDT